MECAAVLILNLGNICDCDRLNARPSSKTRFKKRCSSTTKPQLSRWLAEAHTEPVDVIAKNSHSVHNSRGPLVLKWTITGRGVRGAIQLDLVRKQAPAYRRPNQTRGIDVVVDVTIKRPAPATRWGDRGRSYENCEFHSLCQFYVKVFNASYASF